MSAKEPADAKPARHLDSAYKFSFAVAVGLILFIGGLVISLVLGSGSSIGLLFGVPLLLAGLIVPLVMMRENFKLHDVSGQCPYCSTPLKTSDATIRFRCPNCKGEVAVRDEKLYSVDSSS